MRASEKDLPVYGPCSFFSYYILPNTSQSAGTGGAGGATGPPQYLADQLTLFQPGVGRCPPLPLAPPKFFTFRHHCVLVANLGTVVQATAIMGNDIGSDKVGHYTIRTYLNLSQWEENEDLLVLRKFRKKVV